MQIGDVTKNTRVIEMIRKNANTILVDLSLAVNKVYGQRVGLVVEKNGMNQVVHLVYIEDILRMNIL